jgi:hypothetical protein
MLKSIFISLPFTIEIGADKSDFFIWARYIIMFLSFGIHLSKLELITLFHSFDPFSTKLCLVISRLCYGTRKIWLEFWDHNATDVKLIDVGWESLYLEFSLQLLLQCLSLKFSWVYVCSGPSFFEAVLESTVKRVFSETCIQIYSTFSQ